jgi:pimeloyl-ACP methyl ester carboxylesterase
MREVLEGLGLEQTRVFGLSLGAFVALKTASVIPERIVRMALLVPEGLAKPRMIPFARSVTWPAIRYLVSRSDADAPPKPAPLLDAEELSRLHAPVLVVTGGKDPLFPGDRVARRAGAVIPNLREAIVVPRAGHVYFPEPQSVVGRRLQDFLVADD